MKIFIQIIIVLLITNLSFPQTNYYVSATGSDTNDGSQLQPWATIEYAVNSVSNPVSEIIIINVADGIYDLNNNTIGINRGFINLTILGQSTINTVVQSASDTSLSTSRVFKIYSGNTVTLKNMTIRYGRANNDGDGYTHGGGIFNRSSNLTVNSCLVTENISGSTGTGYGIGISNIRGTLTVSNTTVSYNTGIVSTTLGLYGGGIASINGTAIISNSTISYNTAPSAGGIAIISLEGDTLSSNFEITNSTVSENRAYNSYSGIRISRWGPVNSKTITASFNSCTIFQNYADFNYGGVGFSSELVTAGIQANIKNSIFAGNQSTNNIDLSFQTGIGIINSDGYNIIQKYNGEAISGQTNNGIGLDPNLLPLANNNTTNGTQTCATLPGSPAIDAIPGGNGAPLFDQRGYQRNGDYDIGAFEFAGIPLIFAPTNLTAVADTFAILLNWTDNSTNESGYYIERKNGDTLSADPFFVIDTVLTDIESYNDLGRTPNTTYTYRVQAFDLLNLSPYSNEVTATTIVPVELTSFAASVIDREISIIWSTATELNNRGFELERKLDAEWQKVAFIEGKGTTTEKSDYSYSDNFKNSVFKGTVRYRLAQIDFDGTISYSDIISATVDFTPKEYALSQNYPNPFNPTTTIKYQLPKESKVVIKIYNILGSEVMELLNEQKEAGIYEVRFNADNLSSGTYIYRISATDGADNFVRTKKMTLLK